MTKAERREIAQWEARVRHQLLPKIKGSRYTICIVPEDPDPKSALELGYMVLLDKPIITVVSPGRTCGEHLRRVSDLVIEGEIGPEMADRITEFTKELP